MKTQSVVQMSEIIEMLGEHSNVGYLTPAEVQEKIDNQEWFYANGGRSVAFGFTEDFEVPFDGMSVHERNNWLDDIAVYRKDYPDMDFCGYIAYDNFRVVSIRHEYAALLDFQNAYPEFQINASDVVGKV